MKRCVVGLRFACQVLLPQVEGAKTGKVGFGEALRPPGIKGIVLTSVLIMLAHFTFYTYIAPYLKDRGIPENGVSGVLFAFGAAGVVGVRGAGVLVDKRPRGALLWATGLMTFSMVGLALVTELPVLTVALSVVLGLAYAALPTLLQSASLKTAPATQDAASALFILAMNLGIFAGSGIGGQILEQLGVGALPMAAAILAAVATALVIAGRKHSFPTVAQLMATRVERNGGTRRAREPEMVA
ncbi:MFS transporter [Nocardiopsis rhodophaea]|uniref:MFS transporter n=1 Tax=Nocardiopsis rhodophaea TaxID=280238 RepID=UPI0039EF14EB